jgi:hypothetical protein
MFDRVGSLAETVATNLSRRAFLGRLGAGALVLAGAMGAMAAFPGLGQAKGGCRACCCYNCGNGVIIRNLPDPQCQCQKSYKGCPLAPCSVCNCCY